MVFSGLWTPIIKEYEMLIGEKITVICMHMDAAISNSWKSCTKEISSWKNMWLFSWENTKVNFYFGLENKYPIKPFCEREKQITIHGGGWGMGNYRLKYEELISQKIKMNYIIYFYEEIKQWHESSDCYIIDEKWISWNKIQNEYRFPPMLKLECSEKKFYPVSNTQRHGFYNILENSFGVISKPGGGTLLDSLETETPIIFLEPVGSYEKYNAELWIKLGFGYDYETWRCSGFSYKLLEKAHEEIKKYKSNLSKFTVIDKDVK